MVIPTIGRIVLFVSRDAEPGTDERFAAIVAHVNDDGTVNLGLFNQYGVSSSVQNVILVQDDDVPVPGECEFMPYQKGQAAKYDVTTDDLMSRFKQMEEEIEEVKISFFNASQYTDDTDDIPDHLKVKSTAEQDIEQGMASHPSDVTNYGEISPHTAKVQMAIDNANHASGITDFDEKLPESAQLMGLKAHYKEHVELESILFMDDEGEPTKEGEKIHEAEYTFVDGVSFTVDCDEHVGLVKANIVIVDKYDPAGGGNAASA